MTEPRHSVDKSRPRSTSRTRDGHGSDRRRDKDGVRDRSRDRRDRRHRDRSRDHRDRDRERDTKYDSDSRPRQHRKHRSRSRSPRDQHRRHRRRSSRSPRSPSPPLRSQKPLPSQLDSFRATDGSNTSGRGGHARDYRGERGEAATARGDDNGPPPDKQKPNFNTTGLLAREANRVIGTDISLKYHEPPEARKPPPSQPWRIYIFKGADMLTTVELAGRSCWLVGRASAVVDVLAEHPSCSEQHAVLQFRHRIKTDQHGEKKGSVRPYLLDLESSNGTFLNSERIEHSRYVEVRDGDLIKFGQSEREYVVQLPPKGGVL